MSPNILDIAQLPTSPNAIEMGVTACHMPENGGPFPPKDGPAGKVSLGRRRSMALRVHERGCPHQPLHRS